MQPRNPHRPRITRSRSTMAGLALLAGISFGGARNAHAVTFDFDNFTPIENTLAFPSANTNGSATLTMQAPRSGTHAFDIVGNDFAGTSFAYFKVFDVNIPVTYYTTLEYFVMPVTPSGAFVGVDLVFSDGRKLSESGAVDQFGVRVHPAFQGFGGHIIPNRYNQILTPVGHVMTGTITQILVAYDQGPDGSLYHALVDDITLSDKKPLVPVKGTMVDENNQLFTDPAASVDPVNSSSSCGPNLVVQSRSSTACKGLNSFVALARIYNFADLKLKTRIPRGRDVIVSICGKDGRYECDDHPTDSFCRPLQSTSTSTIALPLAPRTLPSYVGIQWKFIPESQIGAYPGCDKAGFPRRVLATVFGGQGDVDFDGFLDVTDGIRLLRCAGGISNSSGCAFYGDVDGDDAVTSSDAAIVFRAAAGLSPCGADCDTDGDALLDRWEVGGYDDNHDGLIDVDLPAFGAKMFHQDIFVECDYMVAADHTHRPLEQAIATAVNAFAQAPVTSPDGLGGIRLHVDTGNLGGGEALPHDDDLNPAGDEFNGIRSDHFAHARENLFHYCVFGHNYDSTTSSGKSFDIPSDSFIVTLGSFANQVGTVINQSAVFMHELGHNLGLFHGGFEDQNNKPNYLSVMNYSYGTEGIIFNGTASRVDYSRFPVSSLNENALNEAQGLNTPTGDGQLSGYGCVYFVNGNQITKPACATNVDWDNDGNATEASVSVDINKANGKSTLQSFEDWQHLVFDGGAIGEGPPPPTSAPGPVCITAEEAEVIHDNFALAGVLSEPIEEQQ